MLFQETKDKDACTFQQVAVEDAEVFDCSMRESRADVYPCLVSFVGDVPQAQTNMGQLPSQYAEYADVGSEDDAKGLAEHSSHDLTIQLIPDAQPPHQPLYNLSSTELEVLRKYLAEYMA
jgi:hypothetical protein